MDRRVFSRSVLAAGVAGWGTSVLGAEKRPPRLLVRSAWQVFNIGDIGHTPGILALIEKYVPNTEVIVWVSNDFTPEVDALLRRRFPKLVRDIVKGRLNGDAASKPVRDAADWADFFLLSSGATLNAATDIQAFVHRTKKPFGVYGITHGPWYKSKLHKPLMDQSRFVFFRDSDSIAYAKKEEITCPVMEFGPDAAFAVDVEDVKTATTFLAANGLESGKYLTMIPRWRLTPKWRALGKKAPETDEDKRRWEVSQKHVETDHAKLREAAIAFVRKTGMKLLVCPEDMSQMEIGKTMILDKLPEDVRAKAVWREKFWSLPEALGVHARAAALLSYDMHTPIMVLRRGTPAIVCRTEEQTTKGVMWRDIGLGDWLFDLNAEKTGANITRALLSLATDPTGTQAKVKKAQEFVQKRQKETMAIVAREVLR